MGNGEKLTEEQEEFEKKMAFGFQIQVQLEALSTTKELLKFLNRSGSCFKQCLAFVTCGNCCCINGIMKDIRERNKVPVDHTMDTYIKIIEDRLTATGGKWVHGNKVGILDISLYGLFYFYSKEP